MNNDLVVGKLYFIQRGINLENSTMSFVNCWDVSTSKNSKIYIGSLIMFIAISKTVGIQLRNNIYEKIVILHNNKLCYMFAEDLNRWFKFKEAKP